MLAAELDNHLGYAQYERTDGSNTRNGKNTIHNVWRNSSLKPATNIQIISHPLFQFIFISLIQIFDF